MSYNKKTILQDNIEAIKIALSGKVINKEDKEVLKKYHGFGGIKCVLYPPNNPDLFTNADKPLIPLIEELHAVLQESTPHEYENYVRSIKNSVLTSFYTPDAVVQAICNSLKDIPVEKVLEPSAGIGVFLQYIEAKEKTAIEKDILAGKILKALYPEAEIMIQGFQSISVRKENTYDLVISNIPFGNIAVFDPIYANRLDKVRKKATGTVHNYFFLKGLDMLKDGGTLAFITSAGVMDSKENEFIRKGLLKETHLISAIRLPNNLFADTGGIEVQSDLIVLQKDLNRSKTLTKEEKLFVESGEVSNNYYQDMYHVIHNKLDFGTNQYGINKMNVYHDGGEEVIGKELERILKNDILNNFKINLVKREKNELINSNTIPSKGGAIQLSLFDEIYSYADTFEQPVLEEPTVEIKAFEKYKELSAAYFLLRDTEQERQIPMPKLRENLNQVYDEFVNDYGYIRQQDNYLIENDPYINELRGLEYSFGKDFYKADIFKEPVAIIASNENMSIEDALSKSLNELNYIDLDYISKLSDSTVQQVKDALLNERMFFNPLSNEYQVASIFLSGNVIEKLTQLRNYYDTFEIYHNPDKEEFSVLKKELEDSIRAMEKIQPKRIPLADIGINLGERWIPERYYTQFSKYLFNPPGTDEKLKNYSEVKYLGEIDDFSLGLICKSTKSLSYADNKYGVKTANRYYNAQAVLRFAMLDIMPNMTKNFITEDGNEVKIPDKEGIQKMNSAIEEIRGTFKDWLKTIHQQNKEELEIIYNNRFNNTVKTLYDGSYQKFPDLDYKALGISELYSTQKDAILMLKQNGGGIIDHEVGGGKTLIQCVASYEMKRLGLANKPLIIGLKANIHEIATTYKTAYPNAKMLYPSKQDLAKDSIDIFLSKIQNNNWDVIIMSHEQFEKIPQSDEIIQSILQEELDKLKDAMIDLQDFEGDDSKERKAYKDLERRAESVKTKLDRVEFQISKHNNANVIDFKTMGIDYIFVDEFHKYKNLGFVTKHTRAAGLGSPEGSQRAMNLLYAIRTIQNRTGKDLVGVTFLSATIISNSLTELYNVFNYLRPNALKAQGIYSFDGWLATYAVKSKEFEFSVTNEIIQKERFRHFCKVPELASFYSQITDYKTAEMIGIDRPEVNEILVKLEQTPDQVDMYARLKDFAKNADGPLIYRDVLSRSEEKAVMLIATNTAKKAALDMRLIDHDRFNDDEGNKINACVNNIFEYYNRFDKWKGTQFVFSDLGTFDSNKEWDVYSEIKQKLIKKGIPESEIQFIQNFKTDKKKADFQRAMNEGHIRVGIGSTEMLGTGVNAQQRAVAIHHLDIPWTPKDIIQRNGRGARKGNWLAKEQAGNKVDTFIYAVEKTLDVYKFNLQATKHRFITQIKSQNINVRTIDEGGIDDKAGMNYNEYIAILSGDTNLLDKAKLERRLAQLKSEEKTFSNKIINRDLFVAEIKEKIASNEAIIQKLEKDKEKFSNVPRAENGDIIFKIDLVVPSIKDDKIYLIDNPPVKTYDNVKEAGIALNSLAEVTNNSNAKYEIVGKFYEFNIAMQKYESFLSSENKFFIYTENEIYYKHNNGSMPRTPELAGEYVIHSLEKIDGILDKHKQKDKGLKEEFAGLMAVTDKVFPKTEEIKVLEKKLKEVINRIERNIGNGNSLNANLNL